MHWFKDIVFCGSSVGYVRETSERPRVSVAKNITPINEGKAKGRTASFAVWRASILLPSPDLHQAAVASSSCRRRLGFRVCRSIGHVAGVFNPQHD